MHGQKKTSSDAYVI